MAKRYAVVELQLNTDGTIGNIVTGHGEDDKTADVRRYQACASAPNSECVASAIMKVVFDDSLEDSAGFVVADIIKGLGTLQE